MKLRNDGILSMFDTLGAGRNGGSNIFNSINLSDYASIKSGTYGKLMKSYYSTQTKSSADSDSVSDTKKKTTPLKDTTGLSTMKKDADSLKTATEKLQDADLWKQTAGSVDTDKVTSAVKSFVSSYNDTVAQAAKVSSKEVSQSMQYMSSMTNTMSKALAKVGVTVGTDGKLAVDEDTLKKADTNAVKALFSGAGSYGTQIEKYASDIARDALMNSSLYTSNGTATSPIAEMFSTIV